MSLNLDPSLLCRRVSPVGPEGQSVRCEKGLGHTGPHFSEGISWSDADIEIMRSGELMVSGISGLTEGGTDFIDMYLVSRESAEWMVVDSGRIILQDRDVADFITACSLRGLTVEQVVGL